ncbi:MAG: class A beta-lactamase-related serine hydrolase, partial [Elusimicrobia bacterium]|nr:class A beta-lactamase-related serine hydrolase [Elusimicrobiota bacterium]
MQNPITHRRYPDDPRLPQNGRGPSRNAFRFGKLFFLLLIPALGLFLYLGGGRVMKTAFVPERESYRGQIAVNPINDEEWRTMVTSLENTSYNYNGHVGIYLKDLNTGRAWEYNPDRLFPSASLIKLPIMASIFEKIKSGALTLDTQVKLTRRVRAGGSGSLKWVREGTSLSVMEIIYKMITESDNTATKMLVDYVGLNFLQNEFEKLGLIYTKIYPEGFSLTSGRVARENYTTAREMAGLLERVYKGELIDKSSSEAMLEFLKQNKSRTRLRKGLPIGWEIGHKTGLLRRSCHDVGIVFSPRGDYIIAVLTGDVPNYSSAKTFIAKVAKLTYQYYKIDADYAES